MRIYLAATEDQYRTNEEQRVSIKTRHLLVSFNGKGGEPRLSRALNASGPPRAYCVDSGAHFFISAYFKHHIKRTVEEAETHQRALIETLEALPSPPAFVVELDLQDIYGRDVVEAWRRDIWIPFQARTKIPVAFVWHKQDSQAEWHRLLAHPDMHCLGISYPFSIHGTDVLSVMLREAYKEGKPVHGFAQVKRQVMRAAPYYSVDSTSWGAGVLYGTIHTFDAKHGQMRSHAAGIAAFKRNPARAAGSMLRARANISAKDMVSGSSRAVGLSAIYQEAANAFRDQEDWYTAWWKSKGIDWEAKLGEAGGFYARFPPTFR